jgi:MFS family permease
VARVFVGIGEAALAPAVMSMIPDLFPPAKRGIAIGVFLAGMTIGGGVSVAAGGMLVGAFSSGALAWVPVLGQLAPWRAVLVSIALPGFAVALLVACLPEPARRERTRGPEDTELRAVLGFFARHGKLFAAMFGAFALMQGVDYGFSAWLPTLFLRRFAMVPALAGPRIGLVSILCGGLGTLLGGWLADRLLARGLSDGRMRVALFGYAFTLPCLLFPVLSTESFVLLGYAAYSVISAMAASAGLTATQDAVRADMRGLSVSFQAMAYTLFGLGCGPTLVAETTEHVYRNPSRVGDAMVTVAVPAGIAAAVLLATSLRQYRVVRNVLAEEGT